MGRACQRAGSAAAHQAPHLTQYTAPTGSVAGPIPCPLQLEWCNMSALSPWGASLLSGVPQSLATYPETIPSLNIPHWSFGAGIRYLIGPQLMPAATEVLSAG